MIALPAVSFTFPGTCRFESTAGRKAKRDSDTMSSAGGMLENPIIILGAARSGTTLLAQTVLSRHPDIRYWPEPGYVWRYGHAYRNHDVMTKEDATPAVRRYITKQFMAYLGDSPGARFMEKTPGNCLRMPFVMEVFPRAQVVHVLRDGRDVALSAAREWSATGASRVGGQVQKLSPGRRLSLIFRRQWGLGGRVGDLRSLLELPAHAARSLGTLRREVFHSSRVLWGPRFPGLRQLRRFHSLLETCALQWEVSVRMARSACMRLPEDQYMEFRYEDLVREPREQVSRVVAFLRLPEADGRLESLISGIDIQEGPKWPRKMSPVDRGEIENLIGATLRELGYEVGGPS
jgi:hypothetical protein